MSKTNWIFHMANSKFKVYEDIEDNYKKYATVRGLSELYPTFSESSLRSLIFNRETNGFKKCIRRIGRKILINVNEFDRWIDSQKEK